jgi:hypothetical protein
LRMETDFSLINRTLFSFKVDILPINLSRNFRRNQMQNDADLWVIMINIVKDRAKKRKAETS